MSEDDGTSDVSEMDDPFEDHWSTDLRVTSNLRDGGVVDVNGTDVKFFQANEHIPTLVEIYIGTESKPIGMINVARGDTVTLGGFDEELAKQVDQIKEMPVDQIPEALDELAYRLNPTGRKMPDSVEEDPLHG